MDWTDKKIGEALRRSAEQWPDHDFVVGTDERVTYREFDERVDRLSTGLLGLGVTRGDHVRMLADQRAELGSDVACLLPYRCHRRLDQYAL